MNVMILQFHLKVDLSFYGFGPFLMDTAYLPSSLSL